MEKILFVCTGNTCRSPMAEGLYRLMDEYADVKSRGILVYGSMGPSFNALMAMKEAGGDISGHLSSQLTPVDVEEADIILTMTKSQRDIIKKSHSGSGSKVFTLYGYATGEDRDIADPFGMELSAYKKCRDEICGLIEIIYKNRR